MLWLGCGEAILVWMAAGKAWWSYSLSKTDGVLFTLCCVDWVRRRSEEEACLYVPSPLCTTSVSSCAHRPRSRGSGNACHSVGRTGRSYQTNTARMIWVGRHPQLSNKDGWSSFGERSICHHGELAINEGVASERKQGHHYYYYVSTFQQFKVLYHLRKHSDIHKFNNLTRWWLKFREPRSTTLQPNRHYNENMAKAS